MGVFDGRRYAVLGLGKAGAPAADALIRLGAEVFAWDDKVTVPSHLTALRPSMVEGALDALVLSPGIPHELPAPHPEAAWARGAGVPILTDAELLYEAVRLSGSRARFVGVTGTNGKSTTTALIAHVLREAGWTAAAGANLGPAALALPLLPDEGVYVLEMSSYMLERIVSLRFDVAVMLNVSPDHLDRHGDIARYAAAKARILRGAGTAIVGVDDPISRLMAGEVGAIRISAGAPPPGYAGAQALPGPHNAQNAAAAYEALRALGVAEEAIVSGFATYPGLPHRQREVASIGGVSFVDDSKATNADSAARAMGCTERFVWIAGGQGKAGGIEGLAPHFPRVAKAFLIGRDAAVFAATLRAHGVAHEIAGTLERAVPAAFEAARQAAAPVVLLSPAAASFDQFSGFEARGTRFAELARALEEAV